ncbi:MAG: hypothetical protein Q7U99_10675 [Rubrivivax sp.]|nr:hypothetical protein [Rubrivivax sp.]
MAAFGGWAVACLAAMPAQGACPPAAPGAQLISGEAVQAAWLPEPAPMKVGQPFALLVQLCPADAELLRVDATMPEHRHGMNYRPSLQSLGPGRWRVEGLMWHMSGRWELRLDVKAQGQDHRLLQSVVLP